MHPLCICAEHWLTAFNDTVLFNLHNNLMNYFYDLYFIAEDTELRKFCDIARLTKLANSRAVGLLNEEGLRVQSFSHAT